MLQSKKSYRAMSMGVKVSNRYLTTTPFLRFLRFAGKFGTSTESISSPLARAVELRLSLGKRYRCQEPQIEWGCTSTAHRLSLLEILVKIKERTGFT